MAVISPVFERSFQPARWDAEDMYPGDVIYDNGTYQFIYTGAYDDPAFPGGQVAQLGLAEGLLGALVTLLAAAAAGVVVRRQLRPLTEVAATAHHHARINHHRRHALPALPAPFRA